MDPSQRRCKTNSLENQVKDIKKKKSKQNLVFKAKRELNTNYFCQFQGMESFSTKFVVSVPTKKTDSKTAKSYRQNFPINFMLNNL